MKSSSTSSATASPPPAEGPSTTAAGSSRRDGFALTGPSATLDPATHAVRSDLADVRLAAYVFAPHYAAPVPYTLAAPSTVLASREAGAEERGVITAGETFEVLDLVADRAWGMAPGIGRAGWIDRSALGAPA